MAFVGLHIHSDYSLLDGASQLPNLVARAQELNMTAIALTDHGVMYGAVELLKVCKGTGVKPILGNEMYVINGDITKQERRPRYHQIVLAKNDLGYKNLVKMTTISSLEGVQGRGIFSRPCINKDLLVEYHEGLIVTSACLGGEVPQAILQGKPEAAMKIARWYKDLFGDDYYLEIQDHGLQEERVVNPAILRIARELDIKIVATNDSHFIGCNDVEAHDALLCIQTGKLISEDKRLRYTGTEYLKSADEMRVLFQDHLTQDIVDEAIATTLEVADKIEEYHVLSEPRIPDYQVPEGYTLYSYFVEQTQLGMIERFGVDSYAEIEQVYRDRVEYEIEMMHTMGFDAYFLVVWDYVKYAREQGIPVGPGRGSAAGSLVAYALKITNIDPVHHGLLFERFLNPERKSMPDIDTDFCIDRRGEVIDYVTEKYGKDRVAQIITYNRMASKAVLKDVARVLDVPYGESDKMTKMIPIIRGKPAKLKVMIGDDTPSKDFKQKYDSGDRVPGCDVITYKDWIDTAMRIEGTNKSVGIHAAGVVISAQRLDEIVPLQKNDDGTVFTQYYMEDIEAMGLLKMDFLGLKNLTMIQNTLAMVQKSHGEAIDIDEIAMDDPATYKLLARGELEGIFQLESSGMRQIVRDLKPSGIEDISSVLALYRPGPLDAGLIPKFINRKHGREKIEYEHDILKPILNETYGIMVYQEQIMKIAQDMGGYSLGEADLLRRAMGKKKKAEMEKHQSQFVAGAEKNGVLKKVAADLFEQMVMFAEYCFNKSHSTAYGYVTYQTAYLKAHYPVEYMAALITANSGNQEKVQQYMASCQAMGIEVLPPDINQSGLDFTPIGKRILFGLTAVRNVGHGPVEGIMQSRATDGPFKSLADLCDRVDTKVLNKRALEALVHCGALDTIQSNRNQTMKDLELMVEWAQGRARDRASGQGNLFDLLGASDASAPKGGLETAPKAPTVDDYPAQERLRLEKELLGFYISDHPLKPVVRPARVLAPISLSEVKDYADRSVSAIVVLAAVKNVTTKKGDAMAIVQLEDLTGHTEAVIFPKTYALIGSLIVPDARLMVWGKIDKRDEDQFQFILDDAEPIEQVRMVMVELEAAIASDVTQQHRLRNILKSQNGDDRSGKISVVAVINGGPNQQLVRFGNQFRVKDDRATVAALKDAGFPAHAEMLIGA
jgi:DNA polymerase III subunit alpha